MSIVFRDTDVDVVKIDLKTKDGSSTDTYYLSTEFYDADELYSSSPIVYPVLQSEPIAQRGFSSATNNFSEKFSPVIQVQGKTPFDGVNNTFFDLQETHEFHGATVELRYYSKSRDNPTSHSDSVNIRQTLEVTSVSYDDDSDILSISASDVWFKNKEFSRKLSANDFNNLQAEFDGQYGGIAFGDGAIISAPIVDHFINSGNDEPEVILFGGFATAATDNDSIKDLWVRNRLKRFDDREWVDWLVNTDPDTAIVNENAGGFPAFLIPTGSRLRTGVVFSPAQASGGLIALSARAFVGSANSPASSDGDIRVSLHFAEYKGAGPTYTILEPPIVQVIKDPSDGAITTIAGGGGWIDFQFPEPIFLATEANYMLVYEFTGDYGSTGSGKYVAIADEPETGVDFYSAGDSESFSLNADQQLMLELYGLGEDDGYTAGDASAPYAATYDLRGRDVNLFTGETRLEVNKNLEFKLELAGIEDTSGGTYTGTANALIDNPSDIIRFLLLEATLGLGIDSGDVDTTAFGTARTSLNTDGLDMVIAIEQEVDFESFIFEICKHSKLYWYKTRQGKLSIEYPTNVKVAHDAVIQESYLRGDFALLDVSDQPHDTVVNDFLSGYDPDPLDQPKDPDVLRKSETNKFTGVQFLNKDDSTDSDSAREALCSDSETLYGKREMRFDFLFYDNAAAARLVQNYFCDRFVKLQRRATVRLPRKVYHTLDLFDSVKVSAFGLPVEDGASDDLKVHDDGSEWIAYDEGVEMHSVNAGTIEGQVYEIREFGSHIDVTIETVSPFGEA